MELELSARGRVYLATLDQLRQLVATTKLDVKNVGELDRETLVKVLQEWLGEVKSQGKEESAKVFQAVVDALDSASKPASKTGGISEKHEKSQVRVQKQFKISGDIDKTGISFASVLRQIRNGQLQGYTELEIVDGVLKAIPSSTTSLRNYLDSRRDLQLHSLKEILRAHYNEKTPAELYSELGSLVQGNKEEPCDFLIRAMNLRNKILCEAEDSSEPQYSYTPELVDGLFSRSVQTGLKDLSIRQEFRPFLEQKGPKDEELIQALTRIVSRENERRTKRGRTDVHAVSTTEDTVTSSIQNIATEMRALRAEVAELKLTRSSDSDQPRRASQGRGCLSCRQKGTGRSCRHCWMCGKDDHQRRDCPSRTKSNYSPKDSGN